MTPHIIGTVRSHLLTREECPKYGEAGLPPVWVELRPEFEPAATDLQVGDAILVLTWMHQADQSVLRCHPKGNRDLPLRGIFSTRSPDRPTPIGLHSVRITGREGLRLQVHPLEVIDGTPVIDIKPDNACGPGQSDFPALVNPDMGQAILQAGRDGWMRGLFAGFNGNISMRQGSRVVITAAGSAKGHLGTRDLAVADLDSGKTLSSARPSSELAVHLEVYRNQPKAQAVVHTHPPRLIGLSLRGDGPLLNLPLFEGHVFAAKLTRIPAFAPGTSELGRAVGLASREFGAVFMDNHGLVCWGETMTQALGLSEELESLAVIAWQR
ncbi:MAG: tRNA (N6-threonylcarbamoyladenosine(37)-N6)-methyltransferase TrmO [Desulfovibrionales bacterium]|nr:tRNA (N6-threonylcarbamoyladenosine(37)-N6)-methyltransferase TrmO [Desulfovibrionales bacterium]